MNQPASQKRALALSFGRHAFGWSWQTAVQRVLERVTEIQKLAKLHPVLVEVGEIRFFEKGASERSQPWTGRRRLSAMPRPAAA
jgi:hypothetical protein